MVSKTSICYGHFDGIQFPVIPKAPRSLRTNVSEKSSEGSAFELLADVADRLLQESEGSISSVGHEPKEQNSDTVGKCEEPEVKAKHVDKGSFAESESMPECISLKLNLNSPPKDLPESDNDSGLEHVYNVTTLDLLGKLGSNVNLVAVEKESGELTIRDSCLDTCVPSKSFSSSADTPSNGDPASCFTRHKGYVKSGIKDDDDNSFRFDNRGTKLRAITSKSRDKYRRIRKMLTRYRKVTSTKNYELSNPTCGGVKLKHIYKRERCQADAAFKRRKVVHQSSKNAYINGAVSESIVKNRNGDKTHTHAASNEVKFSINSFKVPELYFEIPETATIGSLKRTVMNAVKDKLRGELHVGILLKGRKVRDNNRTLQQMGISHNCDLETVGFTLETSLLEASPSAIEQEPPLSSTSPITDVRYSNSSLYHDLDTYLDNYVDKNQESIPKKTEVLTEEKVADSKALVPVTVVTTKALSNIVVNYNPTKKCEVSPRRIRRPFSKSEVEALVEAVEFLGPGRWREVKNRAFDDADHRTCVDLKDKWKTLTHTASIPPQQRRGELVPQHLLDRVQAAHDYWSNYQIKHGLKRQREPLRILM
ncbi:homeodomain-like, Ubiquitin-related domain protein [Artemisia annua]|uniref:Homeodomain-like, Ubiquitin-related domain protein n=1 Tax=Artemisia annua TaxID=35608 RepID=A0A2U1KX06_ARTAN|nr:homeodomain-like, Ubiquitin-related domain protein [Artemisia annua]